MLTPDYKDMLSALLAAHGQVRATGDMDLWVKRSPDNAERVMAALARFGVLRGWIRWRGR